MRGQKIAFGSFRTPIGAQNRRTATRHHRSGVTSRQPDALVAHPGRSESGRYNGVFCR